MKNKELQRQFNLPNGITLDNWWHDNKFEVIYKKDYPINKKDSSRFVETINQEFIFNNPDRRKSPKRDQFIKEIAPSLVKSFETGRNISFSWRSHSKTARLFRDLLIENNLILYKKGNSITPRYSLTRVSLNLYNMIKPLSRVGYGGKSAKKHKYIEGFSDTEDILLEHNKFMMDHPVFLGQGEWVEYKLCRHYKEFPDGTIVGTRLYQMTNGVEKFLANIPSQDRSKIKISNEQVVSLDITASHPQILYCLNTKGSMTYIPYLGRKGDDGMYELSKLAFMMIINTASFKSAEKAFGNLFIKQKNTSKTELRKIQDRKPLLEFKNNNGITFESLYKKLTKRNPDIINDNMLTCHELMGIEGTIGMTVLLKLSRLGIPAIQIYDEFVVAQSRMETLKKVFLETFSEVLNGCEPCYRMGDDCFRGSTCLQDRTETTHCINKDLSWR